MRRERITQGATRGLIALGLIVVTACAQQPRPKPSPTPSASPSSSPSPSPSPSPTGFKVTEVSSGHEYPVAISFLPDGRTIFAEVKAGAIRVINASGALLPDPVATLEVSKQGEFGLVGLAVDPRFTETGRIFAYYTEPKADGSAKRSRVVRLVQKDGTFQLDATIIDDIPPSKDKHIAGRMAFGGDGLLYVAVGDTQRPEDAQDPAALPGKILRIDPEGGIPSSNPYPGSRTFALGFRNPFGLAFDSATSRLFAVENGPSKFDEVNLIEAGGNYGHPRFFGPSGGAFKDPIWHSGDDSHGMTGIAVVRGSKIPTLNDRLLFCSFDNATMHQIPLLPDGSFGPESAVPGVACNLDVAVSPDGVVWFAGGSSVYRLDPVFA